MTNRTLSELLGPELDLCLRETLADLVTMEKYRLQVDTLQKKLEGASKEERDILFRDMGSIGERAAEDQRMVDARFVLLSRAMTTRVQQLFQEELSRVEAADGELSK